MFLPTTLQEARQWGWDALDAILITGDSYIDSPFIGAAVIGRWLAAHGLRTGIIAQPDIQSPDDITRLGEPALFWGITGGSIDSMVANTTATKKRRNSDDYTPGGANTKRPDRAVIAYSNLVRRYFKDTAPIVLGGIEASLRRVTHYDYWSNKLRRSILFDAKADYLLYGMAEKAVLDLANTLQSGGDASGIPGLCYLAKSPPDDYIVLPSWEACAASKDAFTDMFHTFYRNNDPLTARGLAQGTGDRWWVQNPPQPNLTTAELDAVHELPYERDVHPRDAEQGVIRALDTIRFSIPTHRGCYGECNFCAIAVHQGRTVLGRSPESILNEARTLTQHPKFKGIISDVGGPTANMYGYECAKKLKSGPCPDKRCLYPELCPVLKPNHQPLIDLYKSLRKIDGIRQVFVASGIRYDLVMNDQQHGDEYLRQVTCHHTSGQLKIAPEHTSERVLTLMGKPGLHTLESFKRQFEKHSAAAGKKQFLTYYFIAAHPGCSDREMHELKQYASKTLSISPEQVQVFTPTPSTYSSLMYYTEKNPFTGEKLRVMQDIRDKQRQKDILVEKPASKAKHGNPGNTRHPYKGKK